ncbi:MAG: sigma-70 family RNA polymerase sigma factor [Deltaproteobacteria bacterium]|nr:sigma-70 family RNA polymerase sigma factor [Deltaproteobacteria bacterium]MCW5804993.1 sigma-70 family RNA polymerase sigma factor [Deltaproteobacteria bacterium]
MADEDVDLDRARQGDREAFGRLVRRHQRRVYAAALHILGSHSDADDVTQESFVRAYRGLASFDGRADFFTWLYRITVNTALNALRSDKRGNALHNRGHAEASHVGGRPEALGQSAQNPAQKVHQSAEVTRVLEAVATLSAPLRVTLVLATVEELPHRQIAEILDIPEGTVAWRVNEARRLLKLKLATAQPSTPIAPTLTK